MKDNSDSTKKKISVPNDANIRIDTFLQKTLESLSRTRIKKLINSNRVTINDKLVKASYLLKGGEIIDISIDRGPTNNVIKPKNIPLDIIYEDDDIVVINKP